MTLQQIIYYKVRHLVPRAIQISLRRRVASRRLRKAADRWPIDHSAADKPAGFTGWPDGKRFALVLRHDVEQESGMNACRTVVGLERKRGLKSAFYFVPERYAVDAGLRADLSDLGFEVGVHGLKHDGFLYYSRRVFSRRAIVINEYLHSWGCTGFASPSSHHRLDWLHKLDITHDSSTFDTDPFEPQPDALQSIFPMVIREESSGNSYVELPYTLPQDFTLFVILREPTIDVWKRKVDWIARNGGMVLLNVHPDYMSFGAGSGAKFTYPVEWYEELLDYVQTRYKGEFWHALPREVASFWRSSLRRAADQPDSTKDSQF